MRPPYSISLPWSSSFRSSHPVVISLLAPTSGILSLKTRHFSLLVTSVCRRSQLTISILTLFSLHSHLVLHFLTSHKLSLKPASRPSRFFFLCKMGKEGEKRTLLDWSLKLLHNYLPSVQMLFSLLFHIYFPAILPHLISPSLRLFSHYHSPLIPRKADFLRNSRLTWPKLLFSKSDLFFKRREETFWESFYCFPCKNLFQHSLFF